jgi:hypothetical protein
MAEYTVEIKRYEQWDREDPEDENSPEVFTGYMVFSTIKVGPRLEVRTTRESVTGQPARAQSKVWWVEYVIATPNGTTRGRITPRTLTQHTALQHAERVRAQFEGPEFVYPDQAAQHFAEYLSA